MTRMKQQYWCRWFLRADARRLGVAAIVVIASVFAAGCSSAPGVVFDAAKESRVWPGPPDVARIAYVGQLRGQGDLKPQRGVGESIGEFLFGKEETVGMVSPMGVCTDGADRVFVADSNAQVVHVYDLKRQRYVQWVPKAPMAGFSRPVGIAWDGTVGSGGRVLVSDAAAGFVFVFDSKGTCTGTIGKGVLKRPCGVAVDRESGRIAVVDVEVHQVVVMSSDGAEVARLGGRGSEGGLFNFPTYVAFDNSGNLYVSDSLNFRVQVFGSDLAFVRAIGRKGDMPGYFSQPKGLAVDSENHLYVVDANFEAVQVFDSSGALLMTFGSEGRGVGEFWLPVGIFCDGSDRLWVADSYNRRVQVFQFLGEVKTAETGEGDASMGARP